jgi:hypothetical protein
MPLSCPSPQTNPKLLHPVEVEKVISFSFTCVMPHSNKLINRVLIAADDALKSATESVDRTSKVDKKFKNAIHLLSEFEMDFLSGDPMSDPNIGRTETRKAKSYKSKSPSTILHALKSNLHAKVKFPSVSLPLNADEP